MKEGLQDKGARVLIADGNKEVKSRSRKYRTFERANRPGYFYFVGKKGALRTGKNASSSISIGRIK